MTDAKLCDGRCKALREMGYTGMKSPALFWIREKGGKTHHAGFIVAPREYERTVIEA